MDFTRAISFNVYYSGIWQSKRFKMHIENFSKWGYPNWFRFVTGIVEFVGALLLIVGYWNDMSALVGAAVFVAVGIGGVITHFRVKDTMKDTALILILGILALVLLIILL